MDGTSINNEKLINDVEDNLSRNEIQIEESRAYEIREMSNLWRKSNK